MCKVYCREILLSLRRLLPKPKLFDPDIFGWGGGLPRKGVGGKEFGMSFETQGNQTFWRDIPGVPEKFEKKRFVFNFRPLKSPAISIQPASDLKSQPQKYIIFKGLSEPQKLPWLNQKFSRRLKLSISKNTPHGRSAQGPGQCGPNVCGRFAFPSARNPRI